YHPKNNPDGWYPALTTTTGANNFVKSTYWLENTSFFRLKNVEFSYTLPVAKGALMVVKSVKFFARGTNLFVLSAEKDLDPETMNAGVTTYPLYRTVTAGFSIKL
ncbi:MAG: SusC/RagA family TonB-linked outer membrane protein, partial [Bacteroidales bacterium]|nr:SusC/RagA family TonB-linked outer membrane protein [Bacteroidales bacterium]